MLTTGAPSIPPLPTNPQRQRTAPSMLHPIFQIARRNRREGQWSLSVNDARMWYDELPTSPLWASYMRKANEVAREMCAPSTWGRRECPSRAIHDLLPHARTADKRGELCGLFDGNRSRAIDPTAVRQDAAVHVGNGSNPAGHGGFEVTKSCGAIEDETDAPLDRGRDESSNPQPDRLEGTCCFSTCVDNGESLVRDCGLDSQQFHNGGGRNLNFGLVRRAEDGESGSPPRLAVREDTRAGRFRHYKVMQDTSRERKAHEYYDCLTLTHSGSLECHDAFHKTRCAAARCSNRGDVQFESTRDLAVGETR
ncbi:hypothetical protein TcCL_Unassigned04562 [Trypanosoma cruzi]|nr:hypothetical protein TcCL_Unassigned04562 [Trypanosoma cruzi]